MKKNTKSEILWTLGIAVFFVIFLSPLIIALSGSLRERSEERRVGKEC